MPQKHTVFVDTAYLLDMQSPGCSVRQDWMLRDEYAPGGGGKGLVYGKQRQLPAVRETRGCVSVTTGSCTGYDDMLKEVCRVCVR